MNSKSTGELAPPFFVWLCICYALPCTLFAQNSPGQISPAPAVKEVEPTLGNLIRFALRDSLSEEIIDDRHWNRQAPRWDGFHVRGLKITPREKLVNHGFWRRYKLKLIEPDESLRIEVQAEPPLPDGQLPFAISIGLKARCEAVFAAWSWGVKGINGKGVADVQLTARIQLLTSPKLKFSLDSPLPSVDLQPRIGAVQLQLRDIRMQELGLLDGQLARMVGDGAQEIVEEILQRHSGKVREKLQAALDRQPTDNSEIIKP